MFSCLKSSPAPSYYAFIESRGEKLYVVTVNAKTKKFVQELYFVVNEKYPSIKKFVEDIPKIFTSNFKTVLLSIFYFKTPEFSNNYKFCEAIKAELDLIEIPYDFISLLHFPITCIFASEKISVKLQDTVIIVSTVDDGYCVKVFQFTKNGYKWIDNYYVNANQEPEIIRKEILRSAKPVKIVATTFNRDEKNKKLLFNLKNIMQKSDALIFGDCNTFSSMANGIVKISKWVLDNSYVKYHFLPRCRRDYMIVGKVGNLLVPVYALRGRNCIVPYERKLRIRRLNVEYALAYTDIGFPEPLYLEPLPNYDNCHRSKITFKVDINGFYSYQIEPIISEEIEYFRTVLNKIEMPKIPVITFVDNLSIICVHTNGEYKFADEWNGSAGEELFISFADEKPKFSREALDDLKRNPASVVFDLIHIMTMPADKIDSHPLWGFTVTRDDENPVLIEYDNFNGKKKVASPASLMAMLLKKHLKVIKNETGEKPKEVAFCFFNKMDPKEKARVINGLKEACRLLKIECCIFKNEF